MSGDLHYANAPTTQEILPSFEVIDPSEGRINGVLLTGLSIVSRALLNGNSQPACLEIWTEPTGQYMCGRTSSSPPPKLGSSDPIMYFSHSYASMVATNEGGPQYSTQGIRN
jgi:hypothetical protein